MASHGAPVQKGRVQPQKGVRPGEGKHGVSQGVSRGMSQCVLPSQGASQRGGRGVSQRGGRVSQSQGEMTSSVSVEEAVYIGGPHPPPGKIFFFLFLIFLVVFVF